MKKEIFRFAEKNFTAFKKMFADYFAQDLNLKYKEQTYDKICNSIALQVEQKIIYLDLMSIDGIEKGFILYQKDSPKSDWCIKEGWGFIREVFLSRELRGQGLGRQLIEHAESKLKDLSVPYIYLTTEDAGNFWMTAGYHSTGEICKENGGKIFIKEML